MDFEWLAGLPLGAAKGVFIALFALIAFLVSRVPREEVYEGAERADAWHNLKLWAVALLTLIAVVYLIF